MRQAGKLPNEDQARRFVDYLFTKKMPARIEAENGEFIIWIHEEDQLQEARRELDTFREEPQHERYRKAGREADVLRAERVKRQEEARRNVKDMRAQWNRPPAQSRPLTLALIVISVIVAIMSSFSLESNVGRTLSFVNPAHFRTVDRDPTVLEDRLIDIRGGQVWRTITPMFLHGDPMHLVFNMLLMYQLGGLIEPRIGTPRYGLLVLITGLGSIALSAIMPFQLTYPFTEPGSPFVLGMSGVVFGLIGYLWVRINVDPFPGLMISPVIFMVAAIWIMVGMSGVLDKLLSANVSNWGHVIGLVLGMGLAYIESAFSKK